MCNYVKWILKLVQDDEEIFFYVRERKYIKNKISLIVFFTLILYLIYCIVTYLY